MGRATPGRRRKPSEAEEFLQELESVSRGIRDPVAKLHFIRTSLLRHETLDRVVRTVPWAPARRVLYRWLSLEELRHLLGEASLATPARVSVATRLSLVFGRAAVVGLGLILGVGVGAAVYRHTRPPALPLMAAPRQVGLPAVPPPANGAAPAVSTASEGVAPSAIWLVEKGPQWELYSNGLRIDTSMTVK